MCKKVDHAVTCCKHVGIETIESMLDITVTTGWLVAQESEGHVKSRSLFCWFC